MNKKRFICPKCKSKEYEIERRYIQEKRLNDENNKFKIERDKLRKENEQLRTQLIICQQSKNDDGRFQVWEVPPIRIGTKITTSTTFNGDKDEI